MPSLLKMTAEMGLNISPFQRGLQKAGAAAASGAESIGRQFSSVIGRYFGVSALIGFGASIVRRVSEIKDLAEQFNLTTDEVQQFGKAFEDSGLQAQDAGAAIDRLNRSRREAVETSQELRDRFASFGISVEQLNDAGTTTAEIFRRIGVALEQSGIGDKERAALMELMGKSGARFAEAMKSIGTVRPALIDEEHIKRIDEAEKHLRSLRREVEAFYAVQGSNLLKGDFAEILKTNPFLKAVPFLADLKRVTELMPEKMEGGRVPRAKIRDALQAAGIGPAPDAAKKEEEERKKKLFEDGIAARERLASGKAQAEVESRLSAIAFGKLNKDEQIEALRQQQRDLEEEIAHQKAQQVNLLYTEEIRQQNIATLKVQQLEAEEKILAIQKQRGGGIGFEGFRKLAQAGGLNAASYAALEPPKNDLSKLGAGIGQTVEVLKQIDAKTGGRRVVLGR